MPVNKKISFSIGYVFLAIFAVVLVHDFIVATQKLEELPYSEFRTLVAAGKVVEVYAAGLLGVGYVLFRKRPSA